MFEAQTLALSAAHKAFASARFVTIAEAQETVEDQIAALIEEVAIDPIIYVSSDESGVWSRMTIVVDPTRADGDAFAFSYVGVMINGGSWQFTYDGPVEVSDKQ